MVIMLMPPPTTATTAYLVTLVMNSSTITMFIKDRSSKKPRQNQLRGSRTVTQNRLCHEFPDRARRGNRWPCRFFRQTQRIGRIFRGWLDKKVAQISAGGNSTKTPTALASAAANWKGAKKTAWEVVGKCAWAASRRPCWKTVPLTALPTQQCRGPRRSGAIKA